MISITTTTLSIASRRLTAEVQISVDGQPGLTTYPSFSEDELLKAAEAAGRTDWSTDDVLTLARQALGEPALAAPLPTMTAPPVEAEAAA